jgi:hypothetical protein
MKHEGIDGSASAGSNVKRTTVNGQSVVVWSTPTGSGELVFQPSVENEGRPMESLRLNLIKIAFNTTPVPVGSSAGVADEVNESGDPSVQDIFDFLAACFAGC